MYELVNLIFKFSDHSVELETVQEWFCGERTVDFRCFLQSLVEGYAGLLQVRTLSLLPPLSLHLPPSLSLSPSISLSLHVCAYLNSYSTPTNIYTIGECYSRTLHEALSETTKTGKADEERSCSS